MIITLLVGGAFVIAIARVLARRRRETEMVKKQKFDQGKDMYDDVANGDEGSAYEEIQDQMYEGYYETVNNYHDVQHQSGDYLSIEPTNEYLQIF
jgi:hypothetical protein